MKTVSKKILPAYFQDVKTRKKNFEIRLDEDNVEVGDLLILEEWDGNDYTGSTLVERVKYVLRNVPEYGLMEGYCIISW